jgi:signal transduction histidine kinase
MLGAVLDVSDEGCAVCHNQEAGGNLPMAANLKSEEVMRIVAPIPNKPECHSCHDPDQELNGLMALDRSLGPARAAFRTGLVEAVIVVGIFILVMMFLFRWYFRKHVINRVSYLESLARRIINDELDLGITISGEDELASLAESFDNMKQALKNSIDRIQEHHGYLHDLLNNLTDGILIVDDKDRVVFLNDSFWEVLNLKHPRIKEGTAVGQFLKERAELLHIRKLIGDARQFRSPTNKLVQLTLDDSEEQQLEIHAGPLHIQTDNRPEVIIVVKDVTNVITLEKQISHSERLATVGRLAAGVAHEINNPMASILACAQGLLKRNETEPDGTREYLKIITSSAQRCKMATQKLLDYSATSDLRRETVSIASIVNEVVDLLQFEASTKKVSLNVVSAGSLPLILGSRDSLLQVFMNLVVNGIQAIDKGGEVDIRLGIDDSSVIVEVNDNGCGMTQEVRSRAFDPFYTTKPVGMGTGLGLSVSQGIVKQHNGKIEIVESRGERTCVRVLLPFKPLPIGSDNEQTSG